MAAALFSIRPRPHSFRLWPFPPRCLLSSRAFLNVRSRLSSTSSTADTSTAEPVAESDRPSYLVQKQKQKADWKRRQQGSNFIDTLSLSVVSGRGGAGGVAFHREKFKARGPPSGGPGGSGGSVYLVATPTVTSLSHLPRTVRGGTGSSGGGKWLAGKRGEDVVIRVPVGTIVREVDERLRSDEEEEREQAERQSLEWAWQVNKVRLHEAQARDVRWNKWKKLKDSQDKFGVKPGQAPIEPWYEVDEQEFESEKLEALSQFRKRMFTMYPQAELTGHPSFLTTEHHLLSKILSREVELPGIKKPRRQRRSHRKGKHSGLDDEEPLLYLDLTKPTPIDEPILLVSGGQPGLGNPSFLTHEDRSPKYATKGGAGETMRLTLEVKSNGEVGLVGLPNAGKSTLLRALTSSTPRVASFAFTTLNPHLGTCVVYSDGTFSGPKPSWSSTSTTEGAFDNSTLVDTPASPTHFSGQSRPELGLEADEGLRGHEVDHLNLHDPARKQKKVKKDEVLRFTITDNPGLLPGSHLNHGLGHEFLRHIERCTSLVYVVDLSSSSTTTSTTEGGAGGGGKDRKEDIRMDPVESLKVLETSLREYEKVRGLPRGELVKRVKGVVGNKCDLFGPPPSSEFVSDDEGSREDTVEQGRERLRQVQEYVKSVASRQDPSEEGDAPKDMWVIPISAKNRQNVESLVRQLSRDVVEERDKKQKRLEKEELEAIEGIEEDREYDRWVR